MKTNKEIREFAANRLRGAWLWRVLGIEMLLGIVAVLAIFVAMRIEPVVLSSFVNYLFSALISFGMAAVGLKLAADDSNGIVAAGFSGYKRPFPLLWLFLLTGMKIFLWSLLLIVPGFIAMYRYRMAWYIKCENPELSAVDCIERSKQMMEGYKMQAFKLDLSYVLKILLAYMVTLGVASIDFKDVGLFTFLILLVVILVAFAYCVVVGFRLFAARAIFYTELKARQ